jgi:hypothetical protein
MSKISKSPERHTFQAESYVKRCEEEGKEPSEDYLNFYKSARQQDEEKMIDPKWQKNNLEYDLRSTDWILEKVRNSESYAQNLYAAMCNMQWCKLVNENVTNILKEEYWHCSWRYSGGIIADMREQGDYIDWYCSGIGGAVSYDEKLRSDYVPESTVTEEIAADLKSLGWIPVEWKDE